MSARKRTALAVRLFNLHPIYRGVEAGAFAYLQVAMRMALDPRTLQARKETIRQLFHDGSELLGWIRRPAGERERIERTLETVKRLVFHLALSPDQKLEYIQAAGKQPCGRPPDSKYLAVYALEAKAVRPEATWKQITTVLCPLHRAGCGTCTPCCVENLKSQVKRLRSLLRRSKNVIHLIIAPARHPALKCQLQALLASKH